MTRFPNCLRRIAAGLGASAALAAPGSGAVIAQTSFESEPAVPGFYTDTGAPGNDHDLANHAGEPLVGSTAASTAAGQLGFTAHYRNARGGTGVGDGDYIGVTSDASAIGAFPDGGQGYQLSDADGAVALAFAPVDLAQNGVVIEVDVFVREADWEPDDRIRVVADLDGAPDLVLLDTSGSDVDDLGIESRWRRLGAAVPDTATAARISVELESDAASEAVFVDRASVLPEPGVGGLLAGVLLLGRLRRRSHS